MWFDILADSAPLASITGKIHYPPTNVIYDGWYHSLGLPAHC